MVKRAKHEKVNPDVLTKPIHIGNNLKIKMKGQWCFHFTNKWIGNG